MYVWKCGYLVYSSPLNGNTLIGHVAELAKELLEDFHLSVYCSISSLRNEVGH
jgi:hypothetical protein